MTSEHEPEHEPAKPQRLLTADELGERWQVPRSHVYSLARSGRVPMVRIGRYMRFSLSAIEEFERRGGTGSPTT